jgi:putative membrane-bound dehydrogenase-like protein
VGISERRDPRAALPTLMLSKALRFLLLIPTAGLLAAEEKLPSYPPVEPAKVAQSLRVKNGFTMDLIAAEPLVTSPIAMCYDEDGAAYVVEMRDYPYTNKDTHQAWKDNTTDAPIGRVTKLIDRDGDGVFDESHIFADGLSWPTGICMWKGGVFVTATPDIWYFKDTDGDNRADVREKVFTGFRKYNVQAVINTPQWSLDNRIIIAGSSNGGQIKSLQHPDVAPLKITRNDLRIDPRTGTIEAIAGGARFGQGMDDWGDRFLCNIRNPAQHVVFDGTLAARNPYLPVPNPVYDARESGDQLPVKRISPIEPWREVRAKRWVSDGTHVPRSELVAGGVYTSAAGITVYRGTAYPPEYRGQIFTAEVANNLVQRQSVQKDGVTFKIDTADKDTEFIASTDIWFRPVNFVNAPDGTLDVVDMYRETIEHPWSIPDDIRAKLDLEKGRDRGRIYRLTPPGFKAPKPPRLGRASTAELVATLENPNGWWRDTAQRLLFERQDQAAVAPLRVMLEKNSSELARLHALHTLDGLGALRDEDLLRALSDKSAGIREHAVRLAAPRIADGGAGSPSRPEFKAEPRAESAARPETQAASEKRPHLSELRARVLALARDPEIRVRYHVAFAAGGVSDDAAVDAELEILRQDGADRWMRAAALSAPPEQCAKLARRVLAEQNGFSGDAGREIVRQLMFVAGAHNRPANLEAIFAAFSAGGAQTGWRDVFWSGLGDGLRQAGKNLRSAFRDVQSPAARAVDAMLTTALETARSPSANVDARIAAVRMLAYDDFARAGVALGALLAANDSQPLQLAAVKALASFSHPDVAQTLLATWSNYTPAVREEVLAALLARRERLAPLLAAIENKIVSPGQVSTTRRTQILANPDAAIKARAEKVFGQNTSGSRREAVEKYQPVLALRGDTAHGHKVFDSVCAGCHRYAGRGTDIGPNLETVRGWDKEKLLLNILDPNREVAANYIAYVIDLKDGSSLSGMITEETPGSIKLKRIGAAEETILRQNIAKITSSSMSLMPEGLEATLPLQDMADLLAFLTAP